MLTSSGGAPKSVLSISGAHGAVTGDFSVRSFSELSLPHRGRDLLGGDRETEVALLFEAVLAKGELLLRLLDTGDRPRLPTIQEPELSKR